MYASLSLLNFFMSSRLKTFLHVLLQIDIFVFRFYQSLLYRPHATFRTFEKLLYILMK